MVERTIQTVKKTLTKAKLFNNDPCLAILALRTIPQQKRSSPAVINESKPTNNSPISLPTTQAII